MRATLSRQSQYYTFLCLFLCCRLSQVVGCGHDYECPYGQCCAFRLYLVGHCTDLSTVDQTCGTSVVGICGCASGLTCAPKEGFLSTFTLGEGHCKPRNNSSLSASTTKQPSGIFSLFG
ncbi:uncharacterized protein LOC117316837 [Pecten maximus]|uniref:uncharacterized protein LOC117316837 n=1 Tax=Pecten maximus TaxID=6579 RepID=UPI00145833CF|nr:uncharacterized protein LOC117316837 [Pecten maximus]